MTSSVHQTPEDSLPGLVIPVSAAPPSHKLPKLISLAMPATYPAHASPPALRGV
jgi:hypothetical protein